MITKRDGGRPDSDIRSLVPFLCGVAGWAIECGVWLAESVSPEVHPGSHPAALRSLFRERYEVSWLGPCSARSAGWPDRDVKSFRRMWPNRKDDNEGHSIESTVGPSNISELKSLIIVDGGRSRTLVDFHEHGNERSFLFNIRLIGTYRWKSLRLDFYENSGGDVISQRSSDRVRFALLFFSIYANSFIRESEHSLIRFNRVT